MRRTIPNRIEQFANRLIERGIATEASIKGCSDQEIAEIEAEIGRRLPLAYREFLVRMGRGAGNFYVGTDVFYPEILGCQQAARELIAEDETELALPGEAVVFAMHQGYQFLFLRANEGDDPPVDYYLEQTGTFERKSEHLSKFLLDIAEDDWGPITEFEPL